MLQSFSRPSLCESGTLRTDLSTIEGERYQYRYSMVSSESVLKVFVTRGERGGARAGEGNVPGQPN